MPKARRSNNSREHILDAAQKVAIEKGAAKVSLDSVAKEAGLTKGGVLYNFPSKEALISGMLERLLGHHCPLVDERRAELEGQPNPTLQATLGVIRTLETVDKNIPMAILAAAAQNLELLQPMRDEIKQRYQQICSESTDPDHASLLWVAGEGLMLMDMLGLLPFGSEQKDQLLKNLEQGARELQT
ncbi:MAG: TetR/AcrR family transcriptional regulator [Marinospirillum sp.]|uniref:TetR/AcrR family transcriptional regulator n=1 Tax=Marinospirillum sp. TaxID=2183934 RepID=UPI001A00AFFF|nr:TetR/AcrR family transcriptional regulator [Marinospirillum sp.]MBE0507421.1 TetR/AcrR family transcriptional regulator [Marinospirillum sp.]